MSRLTLAQANTIVSVALKKAREMKTKPLTVVVLDDAGHVKALQREDGAMGDPVVVRAPHPGVLRPDGCGVVDRVACSAANATSRRRAQRSDRRWLARRRRDRVGLCLAWWSALRRRLERHTSRLPVSLQVAADGARR